MDEESNSIDLNDVPETSSEELEQVETSTSEEVDEIQETTQEVDAEQNEVPEEETTQDDIEKQIEERANQLLEEKIEARLIRDRIKRDREYNEKLAEYQKLENILRVGLGTKDLDDTINKTSEFYKNQGVNIPTIDNRPTLNERDARVLAKADTLDIIKCGEKEMEYEANRIASIPREQRTVRENVIFDELCKELISRKNIKELKNKGYDEKILNSDSFKEFSSHIINKPITEVYEIYQKINNTDTTKKQPKNPGSAKSKVSNTPIKEYYTPEEVDKFTDKDWDNPKIMEAVDRSRLHWFK